MNRDDEVEKTDANGERDADGLVRHIRAVRLGHGANCSSVGSVVDTLFVTAVVGGVLLAAVAAALSAERGRIRVVGTRKPNGGDEAATHDSDEPPAVADDTSSSASSERGAS